MDGAHQNDQNQSSNKNKPAKIKFMSTGENNTKNEIEILLPENSDIGEKFLALIQQMIQPASVIEEITQNKEMSVLNEEVNTEMSEMDKSKKKISTSSTVGHFTGEIPYFWIQPGKQIFPEIEDNEKVSTLRKKFDNLGFPKQGILNFKKDGQMSNSSELSKSPDFEKITPKHKESEHLANKFNYGSKTNFTESNTSVFEENEPSNSDLNEIDELLKFEMALSPEHLNQSLSVDKNSQTEPDDQIFEDFLKSAKKLKNFTTRSDNRRNEKLQKITKTEDLKIFENQEETTLPENTHTLSLVYIKDLDKNPNKSKLKFFKNIFKRKNKSKNLSQSQGPMKVYKEQVLQVENVNRLPSSKKTIVEYHLKTPLPMDNNNKMLKKYMVKILLDKKGHAGDLTDKSKAVFYVKSSNDVISESVMETSSLSSSISIKPIQHSIMKAIRENSVSKIYKNRALMGPKMKSGPRNNMKTTF